jgi:hypothetical protein
MATNNEVKAPRPCTLWGRTFDINQVISVSLNHAKTKAWVYGENYNDLAFYFGTDAEGKQFEALQAIASAQRPWLKAEGFEFLEDVEYRLLYEPYDLEGDDIEHNNILTECVGEHSQWADDVTVAFKPCVPYDPTYTPQQRLAKEQEAWDAVAHVEVYKEVK